MASISSQQQVALDLSRAVLSLKSSSQKASTQSSESRTSTGLPECGSILDFGSDSDSSVMDMRAAPNIGEPPSEMGGESDSEQDIESDSDSDDDAEVVDFGRTMVMQDLPSMDEIFAKKKSSRRAAAH